MPATFRNAKAMASALVVMRGASTTARPAPRVETVSSPNMKGSMSWSTR